MRGINGYLGAINKGLPALNADTAVSFLPARNIFTCESHNDMMKNSFRMIEESRWEEASIIAEEVKKFMVMDF